jgi:hypothetical protein
MNTTTRCLWMSSLALVSACMGAPEDAPDQSTGALTLSGTAVARFEGLTVQAAQPTLSGFSPASGRVGDRVVLSGTFLDRARAGRYVFGGGLRYAVTFAGTGGTRVTAPNVTFTSSTSISVTVPPQAATGTIQLVDGVGVLSTTPGSFTVIQPPPPPPAPSFLRIVNNNQYDLVSVAINGVAVSNCANPIAPGAARDFPVMPGVVTGAVVPGLCTGGVAQAIAPMALVGQVTLNQGFSGSLTLDPFTIGELMTNWGFNSGQWTTGLFMGGDGAFHENSFFFDLTGRWDARLDGRSWATGQARVVSWPARASCVTFSLAAGTPNTQVCLPFSGFVFDGRPHTRR